MTIIKDDGWFDETAEDQDEPLEDNPQDLDDDIAPAAGIGDTDPDDVEGVCGKPCRTGVGSAGT